MKKFKKICLIMIAVIGSVLGFAGCGDNGPQFSVSDAEARLKSTLENNKQFFPKNDIVKTIEFKSIDKNEYHFQVNFYKTPYIDARVGKDFDGYYVKLQPGYSYCFADDDTPLIDKSVFNRKLR